MWEARRTASIPSLPWGVGPLSALTVLCEEVQAWADVAAGFRPACLPFIHPGAAQEPAPADSSSLTGAGGELARRQAAH